MAHLHTEPHQYDLTASAYIVRLDGAEPRIMLHKHKKLHQYFMFGGHVELNENPWSAVTHEISEESGYTMDQLKVLQPRVPAPALSGVVIHPSPAAILSVRYGDTDHYHTDLSYAFVTHEAPAGVLDAGESEEIHMFTLAELTAMPEAAIPENVRELSKYILQECVSNWKHVGCAAFKTGNP